MTYRRNIFFPLLVTRTNLSFQVLVLVLSPGNGIQKKDLQISQAWAHWWASLKQGVMLDTWFYHLHMCVCKRGIFRYELFGSISLLNVEVVGINCAPVKCNCSYSWEKPHFEVFKNGSLKSDVLTHPETTEVWEMALFTAEKLQI